MKRGRGADSCLTERGKRRTESEYGGRRGRVRIHSRRQRKRYESMLEKRWTTAGYRGGGGGAEMKGSERERA